MKGGLGAESTIVINEVVAAVVVVGGGVVSKGHVWRNVCYRQTGHGMHSF